MPMLCELCGKNTANEQFQGVSFCSDCMNIRRAAIRGSADAIKKINEAPRITPNAKQMFAEILPVSQWNRTHSSTNMIMTTVGQIEGMTITEQLGLCFGEVYFKCGFIDGLSASVSNFLSSFSFSEHELSGSMELLDKARNYAIRRMKDDAFQKGANAIIGIDMETTYGINSIIHISIYGTAVKAEPTSHNGTSVDTNSQR